MYIINSQSIFVIPELLEETQCLYRPFNYAAFIAIWIQLMLKRNVLLEDNRIAEAPIVTVLWFPCQCLYYKKIYTYLWSIILMLVITKYIICFPSTTIIICLLSPLKYDKVCKISFQGCYFMHYCSRAHPWCVHAFFCSDLE